MFGPTSLVQPLTPCAHVRSSPRFQCIRSIVALLLSAIAFSAVVVTAIKPEWRPSLKKAMYVFPIFYHLSSTTAKSAALLLYIRMASAHQFLRYASRVVLLIVDIAGIVLVFLNIFVSRLISCWLWSHR